jgi:hypothetical protein
MEGKTYFPVIQQDKVGVQYERSRRLPKQMNAHLDRRRKRRNGGRRKSLPERSILYTYPYNISLQQTP